MLSKQVRIQLMVFAAIAVVAGSVIFFGYMKAPSSFFGFDRYTVKVQMAQVGELYKDANVTYRGVEVGKVKDVRLTNTGAEVALQLKSGIKIPADLNAEVHSVSAVGEQYVALLPRSGNGPALKNGDVITVDRTSVPPGINTLLAQTDRGLNAIPRNNLKTVVDEAYTAVGGLGPDLSRLISGGATLAIDARKNLDSLKTLIDLPKPILDSQSQTADSIQAWAAHLAAVTKSLQTNDSSVRGVIQNGPPAAEEVRQLFDRLQPTLPTLLANLVSVNQVAVAYRADLEAVLVLLPMGMAAVQGIEVADNDAKQDHKGVYLSFNLNLNLPPPCTTGFLPIQQERSPVLTDSPDRPKGNVYCRIPQDSNVTTVRGARNYPCETHPGKRAATVKMCESDEPYIPLNDGFDWKGDPNATLTGQGVPQYDPGDTPPPAAPPGPPPPAAPASTAHAGQPPVPQNGALPPIIEAQYDPATGEYVGPDGKVQKQLNLAFGGAGSQTWQQMLLPGAGG